MGIRIWELKIWEWDVECNKGQGDALESILLGGAKMIIGCSS